MFICYFCFYVFVWIIILVFFFDQRTISHCDCSNHLRSRKWYNMVRVLDRALITLWRCKLTSLTVRVSSLFTYACAHCTNKTNREIINVQKQHRNIVKFSFHKTRKKKYIYIELEFEIWSDAIICVWSIYQ